MRWLDYLPLGRVQAAPRNPKQHHLSISTSIERFGFADAAILDERTGRLVAGHGRVEALRSAYASGDCPPDGVQVSDTGEWLVPVQRGWSSRSDQEAEAFLVAHNRLTEAGGWDEAGLVDLLNGLDDVHGLGYSEEEIVDLMARVDADTQRMAAEPVAVPGFEPVGQDEQHALDKLKPLPCPHCGEDTRRPPEAPSL